MLSSSRSGSRALLVLLGGVIAGLVLSIIVGPNQTTPMDAWHAIVSPSGTVADVQIRSLRIPRTLTALVVGAALGVSGVLIQGYTRNPMADPGLLGINQGAALVVVATTSLFGEPAPLVLAGLAGFGALAATTLVLGIASRGRLGTTPLTLVLAGAAVSALCAAAVQAIALTDQQSLDTLRFWQVGSLARNSGALTTNVWIVALGLALAMAGARSLDALALGDQTAASLGVSPTRARALGVVVISLLAAGSVSLAGPIAFLGLLVPHLVRGLGIQRYTWQIPAGALTGATVLLIADVIGRLVARPGELAVGVLTAVIGAPLFIHLARRHRQATI